LDNITNIADYFPHLSAYVACLDCGADWFAVAPADTKHFQCPKCQALSGVVVDPSSADFINIFMRPAKNNAETYRRTLVVLNAKRMIDDGAFDD